MRGRIWTGEMDQQLRSLYERGLSCQMIANAMDWSFTRNAVIGRVSRLGLPPRGAGNHPRHEKVRKDRMPGHVPSFRVIAGRLRPTPMAQPSEPLRCVEVMPRNIPLMDLGPDDCRYPTTEDSPFLFCGLPKADGSYCAAHHRLTRNPTRAVLTHAERLKNRRDYMASYRASKRLELTA